MRKVVIALCVIGMALVVAALVLPSRFGSTRGSSLSSLATPSVSAAPAAGPIDDQTFRRIAEAQVPMVVSIRSELRRPRPDVSDPGMDLREFFRLPGIDPSQDERKPEGTGSGFLIDGGLILTNNHVVANASRIEVALFSGDDEGDEDSHTYEAKVVGRDPLTDSALVRLDSPPAGLPAAKFGDSDQMHPGDWVVAIGNPFGLAHTVTVGVISARGRPFYPVEGRIQEMLQTDAAINPGNSGGPLLNVRGEVVGINAAILSTGPVGGNVGIGFAVPINVVRDLLPQLQSGKVLRGRIGVQVRPVPKDAADSLGVADLRGAMVQSVDRDGPAARAGLKPGDVIVEFNGQPIKNSDELVRLVANSAPGTDVPIKVVRDRGQTMLRVKVDALNFDEVEGPAR